MAASAMAQTGQATAGSQDLVVTASFYDQLLHLWSPES
ncbi:hypothetical protein HaLaN_12752 [Haematococcus lacustris]|uniref:Uncharacterized protein n=1 Tax=Haematococcus lacustris TaxID=44745 RepID=A0A699Z2R4_HAELA|nr:hypothetical protein HaLaN_12752 [Haematococcus lacustris]